MITVGTPFHTNVPPEDLTSFAAKICKQAQLPKLGEKINNEKRLFAVGHHTTYQHFYLNFPIDGIAVGDVTLGLHLVSPFYNSDQRSGRFCAEMFLAPDFLEIASYISDFWPAVSSSRLERVMSYIRKGVAIYQRNIKAATELASRLIKEERPRASEQYIAATAPGIAQEQLRVFIPVIFPTGLLYTVNPSSLAALYRVAWTPPLRFVVGEMVRLTLEMFPELEYMFKGAIGPKDWAPSLDKLLAVQVKVKQRPNLELKRLDRLNGYTAPNPEDLHPVDLLHFRPELMNNSTLRAKLQVEMSLATMGQDQRHRTIARGTPLFTGDFYLPPVPSIMELASLARSYAGEWLQLYWDLPQTLRTLAAAIAPYGAVVRYIKEGSFNAIAHEQAKRLCWCAQEEIYNLSRIFRLAVRGEFGREAPLMKIFEPGCAKNGVCAEGNRYCGRDISLRGGEHYFPEREV